MALFVAGDKCVFKNCKMKGFQDTLYTYGENSRLYYENCYIEGTTDFIFGKSTAWFENCTIHSKQNSYITAAATPENVTYGYVFNKCRLTADDGVEKVYLGRPWRPYAAVLFTKCEMGKHRPLLRIQKQGRRLKHTRSCRMVASAEQKRSLPILNQTSLGR